MKSKQYYKAYQSFLKELTNQEYILQLEADDGVLLVSSRILAHKGLYIVPYWTDDEAALEYLTRAQNSYRLKRIPLSEFMDISLSEHQSENLLIGINWDYDIRGFEVDPEFLQKDLVSFVNLKQQVRPLNNPGTLYLVKDNNLGVCNCSCSQSYISIPEQTKCPWEGSGWLFKCMNCGEHFTFARAVEFEPNLEQFALGDLINRYGGEAPADHEIEQWVTYMQDFLSAVEPGGCYVYLDGFLLSTELSSFHGSGLVKQHDLAFLPQIRALSEPAVLTKTFANRNYWQGL